MSSPAGSASRFVVSRPSIVLFGDSITQNSFAEDGFGARLAHRYSRRADVLNRGMSGYTTRFARHALPHLPLAKSETLLTVIFFGANDAALLSEDPHHHVPREEYKKHLEAMVIDVRCRTSGRVILITPPPVHHGQCLEFQKARYGDKATGRLQRRDEVTGKYAAACRDVAGSLNVPVIDLWTDMRSEGNDDAFARYLSDGLHLSKLGGAFVASAILNAIDASFPELKVSACPHSGSYANSGSASALAHEFPWHDKIEGTGWDKIE